jgi:hypothetical protein
MFEEKRGAHTRSSSNSASALNLLTKEESPRDPDFPRATRGLNFDSNAVSKKTNLG